MSQEEVQSASPLNDEKPLPTKNAAANELYALANDDSNEPSEGHAADENDGAGNDEDNDESSAAADQQESVGEQATPSAAEQEDSENTDANGAVEDGGVKGEQFQNVLDRAKQIAGQLKKQNEADSAETASSKRSRQEDEDVTEEHYDPSANKEPVTKRPAYGSNAAAQPSYQNSSYGQSQYSQPPPAQPQTWSQPSSYGQQGYGQQQQGYGGANQWQAQQPGQQQWGAGQTQWSQPPQTSGEPIEYMMVPNSIVGFLIGRKGETLRGLQMASGTRLQFDNDPAPGDTERRMTIQGNAYAIQTAKQLVAEKIREVEDRNLMASSTPQNKIEIRIPAGKVGLIIGRQACTIKELTQRSGAKIFIHAENVQGADGSPERCVDISGSQECVENARQQIMNIVNGVMPAPGGAMGSAGGFQNAGGYGAGVNVTIQVPNELVGLVIGKGGESIKTIQFQSKAHVRVDPTPSGPLRDVFISGDPMCVETAKRMVNDIVTRQQDGAGHPAQQGGMGGYGGMTGMYGSAPAPAATGYGAYGGYYQQQPAAGAYGPTAGAAAAAQPQAQQQYYNQYYQQYYGQQAAGGYGGATASGYGQQH